MASFFLFFLIRGGWLKGRSFRKLFHTQGGISGGREVLVVYDEIHLTSFSTTKPSHVISLCRDCGGASSSSFERYLWQVRDALLGQ